MSKLIGLWSDSHNFPDLCLMKISAYYKHLGYNVGFIEPDGKYDMTFYSKVFTESTEPDIKFETGKHDYGGSGYNLTTKLPQEVESQFPDYSLYPEYNYAVGFLTRGCPRCNHTFCITPIKDGVTSHKVANINNFWNGQKQIKLLDQNLLACKDHINLLQQLIETNSEIEFSGGLDIRLTTDENLKLLAKLNVKMHHFAWDDPREKLAEKFIKAREILPTTPRNTAAYVLTNYWSTHEQDLERIYWLRDNGYSPFVMIYDKQKFVDDRGHWLPDVHKRFNDEQIQHFKVCQHMQRWCNSRFIFRTVSSFEDYDGYRKYKLNMKGVTNN